MEYRCEATRVAGFVQQLAVAYIARGYFLYVMGEIPERKDPRVVDERLIAKYGLGVGKATRARRKAAGFANVQYLRYQRTFILVATPERTLFLSRRGRRSGMLGRSPSNSAATQLVIVAGIRMCVLTKRTT